MALVLIKFYSEHQRISRDVEGRLGKQRSKPSGAFFLYSFPEVIVCRLNIIVHFIIIKVSTLYLIWVTFIAVVKRMSFITAIKNQF